MAATYLFKYVAATYFFAIVAVPLVGKSATVTLGKNVIFPSAGTYEVQIAVDSLKWIVESNESNNTLTITVTAGTKGQITAVRPTI